MRMKWSKLLNTGVLRKEDRETERERSESVLGNRKIRKTF